MGATGDDVRAICMALPEVELGTSWGDRPTYKVPAGPKGHGFVLYRRPRPDAVDPETGEPYDDVILVRESRLGELSRERLAEVIVEAWATVAPPRLVRAHLG